MDNISEQLIKINKTPKEYFMLGLIWLAAFLLVFIFVLFGLGTAFGGLTILLSIGIIYGAFRLSKMLSIEYEYIVVNRDLDIDKITSKSFIVGYW